MRAIPFAWAAGAAALGGIASSVIGGNAATSAADTQAQASRDATGVQLDMFNKTQANEQPFVQAGTNALPLLQAGIGAGPGGTGVGPLNTPYPDMDPFTTDKFQHSPGYQFQMQQGTDAVLNNRSALGGVNSGNTLKALTQFGQGVANQDYWNSYNAYVNDYLNKQTAYTYNQNRTFNQLQTLTGSGQNAAANLGALGSQTGQSVGNNIIGAGNASAAGQVGSANAISSGINNVTGGLSQNYLLYSLLNGGSFGGGGGGAVSYGSPGWSSAFD